MEVLSSIISSNMIKKKFADQNFSCTDNYQKKSVPSVSAHQFRPVSFGPSVSARQFRNMSFHQLVAMGWIALLREAAECHKANPDNHLRLIGYDNLK